MQAAFLEKDAYQCGYCTSGQIMSAVALLDEPIGSSDDDVREYMSGNLCRCGAYPNIVAAIQQARRPDRRALNMQSFESHPRSTSRRRHRRSRRHRATAQQGASVRFLAGGTTLVDLMKLDVERPDRLIDIDVWNSTRSRRCQTAACASAPPPGTATWRIIRSCGRDYAGPSQAILAGASTNCAMRRTRQVTCCSEHGAFTSAMSPRLATSGIPAPVVRPRGEQPDARDPGHE